MEIWFNPSCSKCAVAREMLDDAGVGYTVRRYLDDPPTADELRVTLDELGLHPRDITRLDEPQAAECGLLDTPPDREAWIETLAQHPALIQRPILRTADGSAWVARSADAVRAAIEREASPGTPSGRHPA